MFVFNRPLGAVAAGLGVSIDARRRREVRTVPLAAGGQAAYTINSSTFR